MSIRTLRREFDSYQPDKSSFSVQSVPINLVFDGTYFGRGYGLMIYRANGQNIYWQEIESEKIAVIKQHITDIYALGWRFSSFTIDGRSGVKKLLQTLYPDAPIQMCIFHQKAIVRRKTTNTPKTDCGKEIKLLMQKILLLEEAEFTRNLNAIKEKYHDFLKERSSKKQFMHRTLRSALLSITKNLPFLFAYKKYPDLKIPHTTNSCDGSFAHWKQKVKIHRGLKKHRRTKMIQFLLQKS